MNTTTQTLLDVAFVEHHKASYKDYLRTFHPSEFPEWVTMISEALNTGSMDSLRFYLGGKYIAVYEALKAEFANSKSDSL